MVAWSFVGGNGDSCNSPCLLLFGHPNYKKDSMAKQVAMTKGNL